LGGGLFGCFSALVLADRGHDVILVEQDPGLLQRASTINQARLHSGLHYPRSILTAKESYGLYQKFRNRWPEAVRDFNQIYAVASRNSKTSGEDFAEFIDRLGLSTQEVDPETWFHPGTISRAFKVEEPSFDASKLRESLLKEITERPNIKVLLNSRVERGVIDHNKVQLILSDDSVMEAEGIVIALYASTNAVRNSLGLTPLPITFELTEVIIGKVIPELRNLGFTVMDGPFWSMMPYGVGDKVSLTNVGLTPLARSAPEARFPCQLLRFDCSSIQLQSCSNCSFRPESLATHQIQHMAAYLKQASGFTPSESLLTVKAILSTSEIDDSRPTLVLKEERNRITTIFSGKVTTVFDLEQELV
jgi:hypothetical protein